MKGREGHHEQNGGKAKGNVESGDEGEGKARPREQYYNRQGLRLIS